jgi:tRNA pseudouridine55 synthase
MDGLLVVDKPAGPTSHDVVARVRHALGEARVGHTGTLDPAASGVLPLLLGRATRLAQFLVSADKVYEATIRLGVATDTYDSLGRTVGPVHEGSFPPRDAVDRALDEFRGAFSQRPPAYSAKKIAGRRSYRRARAVARGEDTAERAPAPRAVRVTAHAIDVLDVRNERVDLRIHCSAGFYVRSLAHDLGERLGLGASLAGLRRTRSGDCTIERAVPLEQIERDPETARRSLVPLARVLPAVAAVVLTDEGVRHALHGRDLGSADLVPPGFDAGSAPGGGSVKLFDQRGELIGIGEPAKAPGLLHPRVVLM